MAIKAGVKDIKVRVELEGDQDNLAIARNTYVQEEMAMRMKGMNEK